MFTSITVQGFFSPLQEPDSTPRIGNLAHCCLPNWEKLTSCIRERSDRVLDSRQRGRWLEPHRRHCVVALKQDTFILA